MVINVIGVANADVVGSVEAVQATHGDGHLMLPKDLGHAFLQGEARPLLEAL